MSDYRVKISVRNARLLRAIELAGHKPGLQFSEAVGINYGCHLLPYLNLQRSPIDSHGLIRECAWALCDYLRASPSDLWSDAQLTPLKTNHASVDVDENSMQALIAGEGSHLLTSDDTMRLASKMEAKKMLNDLIDALPRSHAAVLRYRFFEDLTLDEISQKIGVTRERVRQIEQKAVRNLRLLHCRDNALAGIADAILADDDNVEG